MTDDAASYSASVGVIVVAAGAGTRLGSAEPKAFVKVGGRSILSRALDPVFAIGEPVQVVVVAPSDYVTAAQDILRTSAGAAVEFASVVAGGETRQASVAAGISALWPDVGVVLVHDAARPFTPTALFSAVIARVRSTRDGVIPGLPVTDTLKKMDGNRAAGTVDRSSLSAVQTPQGFPHMQLMSAYVAAGMEYTDDAALFQAAGHVVHVITGDARGFKITTPWDLHRAEELVASHTATASRVGTGIDVHAFEDWAPLWLGGLFWPDERGLSGHSDGDAVAHAVCDALLSAAGLGDMGSRFGTSDPKFADAHGEVFIRATVEDVLGAGFRIQNVAVQVVGNSPKIGPRRAEIEAFLGELVGAPVSVSATTTDGLGFTGRGEGVTAMATALLVSPVAG